MAPWATATGIDIAASLPAGTSMAPVAVCPRAAVAVPTVNTARSPGFDCAQAVTAECAVNRAAANTVVRVVIIITSLIRATRFAILPQKCAKASLFTTLLDVRVTFVIFKIELEREQDGRWIAEIPELAGVLCYGADRTEAVAKVQALALRVLAERLEHREAPGELLNVTFQAA